MVSQITLGNYFSLNGKQVLGGAGGSGLDTQTLIQGLTASLTAQTTQYKDQITQNNSVSSALNTFQGLLQTFQGVVNTLRNPPGVDNSSSNIFDYTTTGITASDGSVASDYLNVTAQPGAAQQTYNISQIKQLASAASQSTGSLNATSADTSFVTSGGQIAPGTITLANGQAITLDTGDSLNTIAAKFNAADATSQSTEVFTVASADTPITASSSTPDEFTAGTITLNGQNITLAAGDTLNDIATKFNNVSGQTGISATVTNVAAGQYRLTFSAANGSTNAGFDLTSTTVDPGNTVFGNVGLTAATAGINATVVQVDSSHFQILFAAADTGQNDSFDLTSTSMDPGNAVFGPPGNASYADLSAAVNGQDAKFTINGVPIDRSTNTISDVIGGLTFNLTQPFNTANTANTNLTVTVQPDTQSIESAVTSFVNAYNAIQTFAAQQTQLNSNGTYATAAVLATNQTFRSTMASLNQEIVSEVAGISAGNPASLSDIGITLTSQPASGTTPQVSNILSLNSSQLSTALSSNFQGVQNLFGFNLTSDNANLAVYQSSNSLGVTGFTLVANPFATQTTGVFDVADADTPGIVSDTPTAGQLGAGVLTINGQSISLDPSDTLNTIANNFNTVADESGLSASVVQVGTGQFELSFAATPVDGGDNLFDLTSGTIDPANEVFSQVQITATPSYQATYSTGTSNATANFTPQTISGSPGAFLTGPDGSPLAGLQLIYASNDAANINVNVTQGIADAAYNTTSNAVTANTGTIAVELQSLQTNDTTLNNNITQINAQVSQQQTALLNKFSALEQAVSESNLLLDSLAANSAAQTAAASG